MADSLTVVSGRRVASSGPMGQVIEQALTLLHATDERGTSARERAVAQLREQPEEAARALRAATEATDEHDVVTRWSLLWLAGELRDVATRDWLVETAVREVPPDPPSQDLACERPSDGEVLIRTMATEAAGLLEGTDRATAVQALLDIIAGQPHLAVRAAAASQLLAIDESLRDRIRELVEEDQRWIADQRRVSYTELTADPGRPDPVRNAGRAPHLPNDRTTPKIR